METKLCKKCNTVKSFNEFGKRKTSPNGINFQCISCEHIYKKEYRSKEKSKILIRGCKERYKKKHPEKILSYYLNNKEKHAAYNKKHRKNNIEHYNITTAINNRKNVAELSDNYVKKKLCSTIFIKYKDIPQELIELKRIQLKTYRLCQQLQN